MKKENKKENKTPFLKRNVQVQYWMLLLIFLAGYVVGSL